MSGPPPSNPFATRFVRPGALAYRLPPGLSLEELVARLRDHAWQGQIVGPHGSGKSSLVTALEPALTAAGRELVRVRLRDGQRRWPAEIDPRRWHGATLVIVDGYEQLDRWARWRLARRRRRAGGGLLVTAHASVGLPTIWETRPTAELLAALVADLLRKPELTEAERALVDAAFERRSGDLREALFDLFDDVERGRWPA
jgi:hypothetical protein